MVRASGLHVQPYVTVPVLPYDFVRDSQADAAGGFIIALWHPEGTNTRTHLHQFNYSNDEKHIAECMKNLQQRLDEHANNAPKKAELKKVEPPRPPVNMFGAQVIEGDSKPSD